MIHKMLHYRKTASIQECHFIRNQRNDPIIHIFLPEGPFGCTTRAAISMVILSQLCHRKFKYAGHLVQLVMIFYLLNFKCIQSFSDKAVINSPLKTAFDLSQNC